jgi:hypothetical protein
MIQNPRSIVSLREQFCVSIPKCDQLASESVTFRPVKTIVLQTSASQGFVLNPLGIDSVIAQTTALIFDVILIISFKPNNLAIALKGHDMGRNSV